MTFTAPQNGECQKQKYMTKTKNVLIKVATIAISLLFLPLVTLATGAPFVLTHNAAGIFQTTAILNGELTNTGGANSVSVWFDYGRTTGYGQKTATQSLQNVGTFQADLSGLSACTVYHFRAVAQSGTVTVYGEDKTFTTQCTASQVDIKANNSDGPITVVYDQSVTISWTSSNADSCQASGAWSGTKPTSGSMQSGALTSNKTYTLTCTGSAGSVSDSVSVYVSSQPTLSVNLEAVPPSGQAPLNNVDLKATVSGAATGEIRYQFDCHNNGTWDRDITISSEPFSPYIAQNLCDYPDAGVYTAKVKVTRQGLIAEDTASITVSQYNTKPTVDAGPDRQVNAGETVTLLGSGSDPDGGAVTYRWTCNGGSLSNYYIAQPVFTAPQVVSDTFYTCTLTVTDNESQSNSDTATVYVQKNLSTPRVETNDVSNLQRNRATLNGYLQNVGGGSGSVRVWFQWGYSSNYGNTTPVEYMYSPGYFDYTLDNLDQNHSYYFRAVAQNDQGISYGRNIIFNTLGSSNGYPSANAGSDKQVDEGESVVLQGSGSDPDGDSITYFWSCNNGSLSNVNFSHPTYTAPQVSSNINYTCTLTVSDDEGLSNSDSVNILVIDKTGQGAALFVNKTVQDLSKADGINYENVSVAPSADLLFKIVIQSTGSDPVRNIYLKDTLPAGIVYQGNLMIDNVADYRDISAQAISIGDLASGASKTITFKARVNSETSFNYGATDLINTALVYNDKFSVTDTCKVQVVRKGVAGATTIVSTGIGDKMLNSLLLPLALALLIVWLFKSQILGLDRIAAKRKSEVEAFRAEKKLNRLIASFKGKM